MPENILTIKFSKNREDNLFSIQYTIIPIINEAVSTFIKDLKGNFQTKKRRDRKMVIHRRVA